MRLRLRGGWLLQARKARPWRTIYANEVSAVVANRDVHDGVFRNDGARGWVLLNHKAVLVGCTDFPADSPKSQTSLHKLSTGSSLPTALRPEAQHIGYLGAVSPQANAVSESEPSRDQRDNSEPYEHTPHI